MSNTVTALNGAKSQGYVSVSEAPLTGMITLRGDFTEKAFVKAVKDVCGAAIPQTRRVEAGKDVNVLWMSPDELLIVCAYDQVNAMCDALRAALGEVHSMVVNVSDARAVFDIEGDAMREVVAKLAPVDLRAIEVGDLRRTRMSQVAAAFWMRSETQVRVVCFRSVAEYMFKLLSNSAQRGFEVGDW
jgi:sarcosine oxidase subunit gamma